MGTLTAQDIINGRVLPKLNDDTTTPVRWTKAELLKYLNTGQRNIVKLKPDANPITESIQLAAGSKQSIPSGRIQLVDVVKNMGAAGTIDGRAITFLPRSVVDDENPYWHKDTPNYEVQLAMYDPRIKTQFWVWPPQPASGMHYVEIICSNYPTDVAVSDWVAGTDEIDIEDIYETELINWIMHEAYQKDVEHAASMDLAEYYKREYLTGLGLMEAAERNVAPRRNR